MSDRFKTLFIGIVLISCSSWLVMEFGPRACGNQTREPDGQADTFATEACRLFVEGDAAGYAELLVRKGDITADERYGWFPFSKATDADWEPWADRAIAAMQQGRQQLGDETWTCGKILDMDRVAHVKDMQGRITVISIEIESGDRKQILELGPSVRTKRGRVFQGDKDGVFVRFRDAAESASL